MNLFNFIMNVLGRKKELREATARKGPPKLLDVLLPARVRVAALRLAVIAAFTFCVCKWLCVPVVIRGASMEPAYGSFGFNFCWTLAFAFSKPKPGDVVCVRYAGSEYMLLKRVVALEGQTVEFRQGALFIDGLRKDEPYVKGPCDWSLPQRKVSPGCVYIVGDNRSMPLQTHVFGEVSKSRIKGSPLW